MADSCPPTDRRSHDCRETNTEGRITPRGRPVILIGIDRPQQGQRLPAQNADRGWRKPSTPSRTTRTHGSACSMLTAPTHCRPELEKVAPVMRERGSSTLSAASPLSLAPPDRTALGLRVQGSVYAGIELCWRRIVIASDD